jgi:hypothetical protein
MVISTYTKVYGRILEYNNGIIIYVKICKVFERYFNVFGKYSYLY